MRCQDAGRDLPLIPLRRQSQEFRLLSWPDSPETDLGTRTELLELLEKTLGWGLRSSARFGRKFARDFGSRMPNCSNGSTGRWRQKRWSLTQAPRQSRRCVYYGTRWSVRRSALRRADVR